MKPNLRHCAASTAALVIAIAASATACTESGSTTLYPTGDATPGPLPTTPPTTTPPDAGPPLDVTPPPDATPPPVGTRLERPTDLARPPNGRLPDSFKPPR